MPKKTIHDIKLLHREEHTHADQIDYADDINLENLVPINYSIIGQGSSGHSRNEEVCIDVSDAYWGLDRLLNLQGVKTKKGFPHWTKQKRCPSGKKYNDSSNLFLVFDKASIRNKFDTYKIGSCPQFLSIEDLQRHGVPKVAPIQTQRDGWETALASVIKQSFPSYSDHKLTIGLKKILDYLKDGWHLIVLTDKNDNLRIVASVERGKGRELRPLVEEFYAKRKKEEN